MRDPCVTDLSPKSLRGALYRTTEQLAAELASPTPVAPEWGRAEWLTAQAVSTIHGITPLLRSMLRWRGTEGWERFLDCERALERQRNRRILELLRLIHHELHSAGVPAVGLKGAALAGTGFYDPGERPMADVDVLVRRSDLARAARAFEVLGFEESCRDWKNRVFTVRKGGGFWPLPEPGEHPIKIELHERICERLPARLADISSHVFPQYANPGLNPYPSRASLMAHLLFHAAGSIVDRLLRLIQLHDIALLADRATDQDWAEVLRMGEAGRRPWWVFPPLRLTARYYPGRVPAWVLDAARAYCPPLLRRSASRQRLSDASLSFPWIQAFPGIAWSRSPAEALEYVVQRVLSGNEAAAMRGVASQTEPGLSPGERRWLAVSQGRRIIRWLIAHPTRPLTMRAVRRVFGERS